MKLSRTGKLINFLLSAMPWIKIRNYMDFETKMRGYRFKMLSRIPDNVFTKKFIADGVMCEWTIPKSDYNLEKCIVLCHGGGMVGGNLKTTHRFASVLAVAAKCRVLSVDYRKAPRYAHPAAVNDLLTVYFNLTNEQHFRPYEIGFAGIGAGGAVALSSAMLMRDNNIELPGAMVLFSPWLDLSCTRNSHKIIKDKVVSLSALLQAGKSYAKSVDVKSAEVSPLFGDFNGLMPMMFHVGEREMFIDDSVEAAQKKRKVSEHVSLRVWSGMFHSFVMLGDKIPESSEAIAEAAEFFHAYMKMENRNF